MMLEQRLKEIFVEVLNIPEDTDFENLEYRGIPEWDSLAHMQLVGAIEEALDIMIDTDDVIDMSSFPRAVAIVQKCCGS